jgi:hypothetical protein
MDPSQTCPDQFLADIPAVQKNIRDKSAIFIMVFREDLDCLTGKQVFGEAAGLFSIRLIPFRSIYPPDPDPQRLLPPSDLKGIPVNDTGHGRIKGRNPGRGANLPIDKE